MMSSAHGQAICAHEWHRQFDLAVDDPEGRYQTTVL